MAASHMTIAGIEVPTWVVSVVWAQKYEWDDNWILASKRGKFIAKFATEAELDAWWNALQESRGREPKPLQASEAPPIPIPGSHLAEHDNRTDYFHPWSKKYDMPEIDFE